MNYLALLFLFICNFSFSQGITISDLESFCQKPNWESVNTILKGKGWQYFQSSEGDYLKYSTVVWSFEKSSYNDKAKGWISLYLTEDSPEKVDYQISDEKKFTALENQLAGKGYKLKSSEVLDNELNSYYHNSKFYLKVIYSKSEDDYYSSSSNTYHIVVTAKGSEYDPDNGPKQYYDDDGIRVEYTLKDGDFHGKSTSFYASGGKKNEINWVKGERNGVYTDYTEFGEISETGFFKNDKLDGERKIYFNDNLLSVSNYSNGNLNGKETVYHENGKIAAIENYINDKKVGTSLFYSPSGEIIEKYNYYNGIREGEFFSIVEVKNQQLKITGNYINNLIEGKVFSIDLETNDTLRINEFKNDQKNGITNTFNHDGQLVSSETYLDDKLNGLSTHYITKGRYSGEIFYKANFMNGDKHGEYEQYYEYVDDNNGGMFYRPATFIRNFKYGELNGKAVNLVNGIITEQGNYMFGEKDGDWYEMLELPYDGMVYKIKTYGVYLKGEKEGEWVEDPEGPFTLKKKTYKKGLLNGVTTLYNNLGKPVRQINFKNDEMVSCTYLENETPYLKLQIIDRAKDVFEVTNYFNNLTITAKFDVSTSQEVLSDSELLEYYLTVIGFSNKILEECKFKSGYFTYKSLNYEYNGYYTNNVRAGNWHAKYTYQGEIIESVIEYLNGEITNEYFTYSNNEPYNDKLEYYYNGMKVTTKIKKGVRLGKTEYVDVETGELVKVEKYKGGLIEK